MRNLVLAALMLASTAARADDFWSRPPSLESRPKSLPAWLDLDQRGAQEVLNEDPDAWTTEERVFAFRRHWILTLRLLESLGMLSTDGVSFVRAARVLRAENRLSSGAMQSIYRRERLSMTEEESRVWVGLIRGWAEQEEALAVWGPRWAWPDLLKLALTPTSVEEMTGFARRAESALSDARNVADIIASHRPRIDSVPMDLVTPRGSFGPSLFRTEADDMLSFGAFLERHLKPAAVSEPGAFASEIEKRIYALQQSVLKPVVKATCETPNLPRVNDLRERFAIKASFLLNALAAMHRRADATFVLARSSRSLLPQVAMHLARWKSSPQALRALLREAVQDQFQTGSWKGLLERARDRLPPRMIEEARAAEMLLQVADDMEPLRRSFDPSLANQVREFFDQTLREDGHDLPLQALQEKVESLRQEFDWQFRRLSKAKIALGSTAVEMAVQILKSGWISHPGPVEPWPRPDDPAAKMRPWDEIRTEEQLSAQLAVMQAVVEDEMKRSEAVVRQCAAAKPVTSYAP